MGSYDQKNSFFYRLTNTCFHSLIIRSDYAIFKETITGPFNNSDTIYAKWAPMEDDVMEVKKYILIYIIFASTLYCTQGFNYKIKYFGFPVADCKIAYSDT